MAKNPAKARDVNIRRRNILTGPAFQRDRDRVIHSSAFRRLQYKTQVFVNHEGDYYRTRITHTMEVAQIARSIARSLGLNQDLTEAIALAHDLGHTPFGHSGEKVLNEIMKNDGGFEHNAQSYRIVTHLEDRYPDFRGLNLTYEVLEGVDKHRTRYDRPIAGMGSNIPWKLKLLIWPMRSLTPPTILTMDSLPDFWISRGSVKFRFGSVIPWKR